MVNVDLVCPSFWGPLALDISVKKASDSDGVCDEKRLIFSAVCCNVSAVLTLSSLSSAPNADILRDFYFLKWPGRQYHRRVVVPKFSAMF